LAFKILKSRPLIPPPTVENVTQFFAEVAKIAPTGGPFNVFRGQRNTEWSPKPGILRPPQKLLEHEREIIRELISVHPQEFKDDGGMLDRLVRMQHFGLPTRLLDVSLNPLVALYFASEPFNSKTRVVDGIVYAYKITKSRQKYYDSDVIACIANLANLSNDERQQIIESDEKDKASFNSISSIDRLLQFIRVEKPYFRAIINREDLFLPYYVIPKMSNRRIIAQSGAFIIHGLEEPMLSGDRVRSARSIPSNQIIIPQAAKATVRRELEALGINESTLFPELDRAASYIVRRFS
jgi:FRG domain